MNKEKEIVKTHSLVKRILEENRNARNSDLVLYMEICRKVNNSALYLPLYEVLTNFKEYGLPSFETVSRTRRKVQEKHKNLRGCVEVNAHRKTNEVIFELYVQS